MSRENRVDKIGLEKRIHTVALMLRRKSTAFIVHFIAVNWGLEERQAHTYIKEARKEWQKYFDKLQKDGMAYSYAQLRDLKDMAINRKVVIGKGDDKVIATVPDASLLLDIVKEENKMLGRYPALHHVVEDERECLVIGAKKGIEQVLREEKAAKEKKEKEEEKAKEEKEKGMQNEKI